MIRINLLASTKRAAPKKSAAPAGSTQVWTGIYFAGVVVALAVCAFLYFSADAELSARLAENQTLDQQIQQLRSRSSRLEEVQAKLAESLALEEVVSELSRGRTGPTRAMMEISNILGSGEGSGPTIDPAALEALRRDNPLATYNRAWDSRRFWLTRFEEDSRECRIEGVARTHEDAAEFLRRLQLSELFDNVSMPRTEAEDDRESGLNLIKAEYRCRVIY